MLRRLAYDCKDAYTVYWLGSNIEAFLNNEFIYDVQKNPESNYLIILEDWYLYIDRAKNESIASQILENLNRTTNARLLIGDRKGKKKLYDNYVFSTKIYDFANTENKNLLENIFKQMPEWQMRISDGELSNITHATLFIILFIFCYGDNQHNEDLIEQYKRIFKSDYNKLIENDEPFFKGMANVLYIFSNLYNMYGITLSIEAICEMVSFYKDGSIPNRYKHDLSKIVEHPILKKYLQIDPVNSKQFGKVNRVRFHHDTMAEIGWANKHELIEIEFSENLLKDLKTILNTPALTFDLNSLYSYIIKWQQGTIGKEAAREYLKTENPYFFNYAFIASLNLLNGEVIAKEAARDFFKTENPNQYQESFIASLKLLKEEAIAMEAARAFLDSDTPYTYENVFISSLNLLKGEEITKKAARTLFDSDTPYKYEHSFSASLNLLKKESIAKEVARAFLKTENPHQYQESFSVSLNLLKEEAIAKEAARALLNTENPHINPDAFSVSLNLLKGETIAKEAARALLNTENPHINPDAFSVSLKLLNGEAIAKEAASEYLRIINTHINQDVFIASLNLLKEEAIAKEAARAFLKTENPYLQEKAFSASLKVLGLEAEEIALKVLTNYKDYNFSIVYRSIKILATTKTHNGLIERITKEIIVNKKKDWYKYQQLLKIPLFTVRSWVKETKYLYTNWNDQRGAFNKNYLYFLTISYLEFPEKLKTMSIGIIRNWKSELKANYKHKAYFTRCLANINITGSQAEREEVIAICKLISRYHRLEPLNLTPDLEKWIKKIAEKGEFPSWKIEEE